MWLGIGALIVLALVALWAINRTEPDVSRVHAKHILIKFDKTDPVDRARALELVNGLRERIMNGESFSKLAKEYSNDEFSSARGGDLGYYRRGMFEPVFEEHVWSAPIGQLSDVVQSSYGFHLIIVVDRHISETDQYEIDLEKKAAEAEEDATVEPAPEP